jgi:hypothetical protein
MRVGRSLGRLFGRKGIRFGFWPLRSVTALGNVSERGDRKTVSRRPGTVRSKCMANAAITAPSGDASPRGRKEGVFRAIGMEGHSVVGASGVSGHS